MKITLSTSKAMDILSADSHANWSYEGAQALVEYLEGIEADSGEEMELNLEEIRAEYSEYPSAIEAAIDLGIDEGTGSYDEDERERDARDYLERNCSCVIDFDSGIIIRD